jgi:predicted DNA-binding protein
MEKVTFAVKINPRVKERLKKFCAGHGFKQGYFVEKAIEEKLAQAEKMGDILEFKKLEEQEAQAISFEEYLKKRSV